MSARGKARESIPSSDPHKRHERRLVATGSQLPSSAVDDGLLDAKNSVLPFRNRLRFSAFAK